jgi:hypothetical protein
VRRAALAVLLLLTAVACGGDDPFDPLADPGPVPEVPPNTTIPLGSADAVLPEVGGTTTTTVISLTPGTARLRGRVQGPDGPVAGATVRLERLVGDAVAAHQVTTGPDGGWDVPGLLGGRFRIRAWRPPDLGVAQAEVLFVTAGGDPVEVDLTLTRIGQTRVEAVAAPAAPVEGQPANLRVRVVTRTVDADGVARDTPVSGLGVSLAGGGDWTVGGANPARTGADGSVLFRITCFEAGTRPLQLFVEGQSDVPPLPECSPDQS